MTTSPIVFANLDPISADLGLLIGLLQKGTEANSYLLNLDWFEDPIASLKSIPSATVGLLTLLRDLLGAASANPPDERAWYPIQPQGELSNFYVVLPKDSDSNAVIGLGVTHTYADTDGEIVITPKLYFPLFSLPITGNPFVLGQANNPIEVVLNIQDTKERFTGKDQQGQAISFDGFQLDGNICFAETGSSFSLNFLDIQPPEAQSTYTTLADLLNSSALDWLNIVLGRPTVTTWLNQKLGSSNETPGSLLVALGLLKLSGTQYEVGDLSKFTTESPLSILEGFVFTVLNQLASNTNPLVPVENGGVYIVSETGTAGTDYGLRLQIPDLAVPLGADSSTNSPQLKLQFGKWLTGEASADQSWLKRADASLTTIPNPGVSVYLVQADSQNHPSFQPKVELVSLGLDYQGGNQTLLIDIQGVTLGGLEPRCYVSIAPNSSTTWGVAIRCDQLGLPLGKGLNATDSSNPIAQNLLDSGSADQTNGSPQGDDQNADPQAVNPAFSAAIAYSTALNFQLYDSDGAATDTVWIPMQRAFGPLHCQKIGVGWQNAARLLSFLYYGGVSLAGLDIELEGLSVALPLNTPGDLSTYQFALNGLDITLNADPVEISGGLQETYDANKNLVYNGEALIKAGEFSLSALGSYTTLNGAPSMFLFAFLTDPLGGPPPCFITGLCGGFGYNRGLTLPPVDQVQTFPFVAGLTDPTQVGGSNATPADALAKIADVVPPVQGEDWLAVGIQFTSFELIQSHALLTVEFGKELEIALLGLSAIKLPAEGTETFTYVELELEVVLKPAEGEFSAIAVLTPNSYVLDPACRLTGGFAFCLWFGDNPHANDFVLTVGGYHPQFDQTSKPWYPTVPRLGFNWAVDSALTISGEAYFALTPSCVMGGGRLEALYQDGGLQAWFIAHADFLITWKPFTYDVSIGISIGVSYTFWFFGTQTIRIELGASLELWGPPTGGFVQVSLWCVSFTVPFGPPRTSPPAIQWADFQALLPHSQSPKVTLDAAQDTSDLTVCHIRASNGLHKTVAGIWCIRADEFEFAVQTAIPLTEMNLTGPNSQNTPISPSGADYFVGIRPMGIDSLTSTADLQITSSAGEYQDLNQFWNWTPTQHDVPEAMWGKSQAGPPPPAANLLSDRLVGVNQVSLKPGTVSTPINVDAASAFEYAVIDENPSSGIIPVYLPIADGTPSINQPPQSNAQVLSLISQTLASDAVKTKRTSLFEALAALGVNAGTDGDLSADQQNVGLNYQGLPMVGTPDGIST
ncbi:MAG: hypothetical protein KME07_05580 [Pegethrix bostrychoides GSE-TBD4-15B]|uniref:DUF6603 domain-containing protein n=1 Tax=Pegethrix bostrychoides GSE-TBD4-15B TaxID=2839662 RepID=A0A951U3T2_9CYAN|nr:hypothetical protein [Pegethrix bostrychoides GSE-TBD4-15B]